MLIIYVGLVTFGHLCWIIAVWLLVLKNCCRGEASGPPLVFKVCLWVSKCMLPVIYFCSMRPLFYFSQAG